MSKPLNIIFDDGTRAKVYKNYTRLIGTKGSYQRLQLLTEMSSGFYDIHHIKKTDEMLLIERMTIYESKK